MSESASSRDRRREQTSYRINAEALRLTARHGLDGWTMDELAEAAGVSRRTLFNYFPGKIDAVLGPSPEVPEELLATFQAGGPTGNLIDDVAVVVHAVIRYDDEDREVLDLSRRTLRETPRLLGAAHQRFESTLDEFVAMLRARRGDDLDEAEARLLLRLLMALYDDAVDRYLPDPGGRSFGELFDEALASARRLLA